jgi:pyruvate/2-oxoglutarate dehydrogenase complex dihydrolipoamide dehydrogenase (E3) component
VLRRKKLEQRLFRRNSVCASYAHVIVSIVRFNSTTRTIIDGQTTGFCKLIVNRSTHAILGCHAVGERAVDIVQTAAIAVSAGIRVHDLARIPLAFPTYAGILGRLAASAARELSAPRERLRIEEWL